MLYLKWIRTNRSNKINTEDNRSKLFQDFIILLVLHKQNIANTDGHKIPFFTQNHNTSNMQIKLPLFFFFGPFGGASNFFYAITQMCSLKTLSIPANVTIPTKL